MVGCLLQRHHKGQDSDTTPGHLIPTRHGGFFDDANIAHALRAEGFDASDDGTGRGTPIIAQTITADMYRSGGAVAGNNDQGVRNCIIEPIAFSAKDHGADAGEIAPTLRAGGYDKSHANGGCGPAIAFDTTQVTSKANRSNPKPGDPSHPLAAGAHAPAIAFQPRYFTRDNKTGGADSCGDTTAALSADHGGGDSAPHVAIQQTPIYANAIETNTVKVLRLLHQEIGEKAFAEWGLGVLAAFLPKEVLQSAVHGSSLRCQTIDEFGLVNYALAREEDRSERFVRKMRETQCAGRSSFGWEPHEQRSIELAAYLSELSQPGPSAEEVLRDLRKASKGPRVLRDALPEVQEVGGSSQSERQPIHPSQGGVGGESQPNLQSAQVWDAVSHEWVLWKARNAASPAQVGFAVRRLTVTECAFLQGFPRNYLDIIYRGKPAADGPKYKALGNSMAVPVMRWIGQRIQKIHEMEKP